MDSFSRPASAAIAAPPGMFTPTGVHAGPLSARGLNQNAVIQTFAPGATVLGNAISTVVRVILPSNLYTAGSVGASSPT